MNKKRYRIITCSMILMSVLMTGCSKIERNNVDFTGSKNEQVDTAIEKMEVMNIYNDALFFGDIRLQASAAIKELDKEEITEEEKTKKIGIIIYDCMSDTSKLGTSRLAADIATVYTNSEKYAAYLAMLQVYVDSFDKEQEKLQMLLLEGKKETEELKSYRMFYTLEEYYLSIIKEESIQ